MYGYLDFLVVVVVVNGDDFVLYIDVLFIKVLGFGVSVVWYQDGIIYWDSFNWD